MQRLVAKTRDQATNAQHHLRDREDLLTKVNELARLDGLTGVANRRSWDEHLRRRAGGRDRPGVSILLIDLDRFKQLNDAQGHEAGDRHLKASAAAWLAQLRPHDLLAAHRRRRVRDPAAGLRARAGARRGRARGRRGAGRMLRGRRPVGRARDAEQLQRRADEVLYAHKRRARTALGG